MGWIFGLVRLTLHGAVAVVTAAIRQYISKRIFFSEQQTSHAVIEANCPKLSEKSVLVLLRETGFPVSD